VIAGDGIEVSGVGSAAQPYKVTNLRGDALARLQVVDTDSVDLTLTPVVPGDDNTAYTLQADSTVSMMDLSDVNGNDFPNTGDVPVWDGTQWVFAPGGGDASAYVQKAGDTMTGGLTVASPAGIVVDAPQNAFLAIDRGTDQDFAQFEFRTAGNQDFVLGSVGAGAARKFRLYTNGGEFDVLTVDRDDGDIAILNGADLVLHHDPVLPLEAATKAYVDAHGGGGGGVADPLDYCILRNTAVQTLTSSVETPITFLASASVDPLGMWNGTDLVTVKRSGLYEIVANFSYAAIAATGSRINLIKINGATNKQWYETIVGSQSNFASHAYTIQLNAGDTIQMRQYQSSGSNLDTFAGAATLPSLHVTRLPEGLPGGGGVVVERPMVARRKHAAATSILHNTLTTIPFDTEDYTDGLFWDSANSAFTAPVDGYYDVEAVLSFAANAAGGRVTYVYVDAVSQGASSTESTGGAVTRIATTVKALAGQKITVRVLQSSGVSLALNGNAAYNFVSITKVPQAYAGSAVSTYGERNYVALRRHITATSLTNNAVTPIPLDTPDYADGLTWSTDGFLVPVTGYYQVDGMVTYLQNATGTRYALILLDGGSCLSSAQPANVAATMSVSVSGMIFATAGQKISLGAQQTSGANLSLYGNTFYTWMSIAKVPAPVINGAAASGVWGAGPLAGLGSNDLVGREIYIDSKGQLRAKPEVVQPRTSRRKGTNQALIASTWANITFDVDVETNTSIPYSSGVFTIPTDGVYQINVQALLGGLVAGTQQRVRILIDAPAVAEQVVYCVATGEAQQLSKSHRLVAGQTITVQAWASAAGNVTGSTVPYTVIDITRVSA